MVLRDSFMANEKVKIIMLTCICPGSSSADHTLNTLRYAERLKEKSGNNQVYSAIKSQSERQQMEESLKTFKKQNSQKLLNLDGNSNKEDQTFS